MRICLFLGAVLIAGCATQAKIPTAKPIVTMQDYVSALTSHVSRSWVVPKPFNESLDCTVDINQDHVGFVKSVKIVTCNGSEEEILSIERAVEAASPLPLPDKLSLFDSDIRLTFCPSC